MEKIPEIKFFGESWAWALFQAGEAWMAWEAADDLEGLGHPHLAGVYREYACKMAQLARPFVEELARHNVARVIHQRVSAILNLSKEEVQNVP